MTSDELKTAATGFLPGAVVGAVVVWLAMSMTPAPSPVPTLPSDTRDTNEAPAPSTETSADVRPSMLQVLDQPAGRAVVVKSVDVSATSWIAVRDYADQKIGNVLGAARREKGTSRDVVVDLLRATEPGKQYAVVILTDNGDGEFSTKTDSPLMDGAKQVMTVFTASIPVAPNGR